LGEFNIKSFEKKGKKRKTIRQKGDGRDEGVRGGGPYPTSICLTLPFLNLNILR
jgi:hypothetical protein